MLAILPDGLENECRVLDSGDRAAPAAHALPRTTEPTNAAPAIGER